MKRSVLLFVLFSLIMFSVPAFGYFSMTHISDPLEVRVCSTGYFGIYTTESPVRELTFPNDGTPCPYSSAQSFIFSFDGIYYRQGYSGGDMRFTEDIDDYFDITYADPTERQIITRWIFPSIGGDVILRQILRPVTEDDLAMIKIIYEIQNNSAMPHTVGIRTILDPLLAGVDNVEVAVGHYYTDVGVFYNTGIPPVWQAFEVGADYTGDQLITRGKNDIDCDQFGLGNAFCFADPYEGVKVADWDFEHACWLGETYIDVCASSRWDPRTVESGDLVDFSYYYGFGGDLPDDTLWINLGELTNFYASTGGCAIDSIQNFTGLFSVSYSPATDVEICIHFNTSSGLYFDSGLDEECVSLGDLDAFETNNVPFYFNVPPGYSTAGDVIDTIYITATSSDIALADIEWEYEYFIPQVTGTPPTVTLLNADDNYINCAHTFQFTTDDDDTTVNTTDMRMSINGVSYGAYTGIFTTAGSTTSLILDTLITTLEGDEIRLSDTVVYCISFLEDMFGCEIEPVCDTLVFDYEPPYVDSIFPAPGDSFPIGFEAIEIVIEDDLAGVDSNTITISVNGELMSPYAPYYSSSVLVWNSSTNTLRYSPTEAYPAESTLVVCVHHAMDLVSICEPNEYARDTCWTYWVDYEGPHDAYIIRPDVTTDTYVACDILDSLIFVAQDASGIIEDSIVVLVNGTDYYRGTDLEFDIHLGAHRADFDTIFLTGEIDLVEGPNEICITNLVDSLYNHMIEPSCVSFTVDLTPPAYLAPDPPTGTLVGSPPFCTMPITDNLGGVNFDPTSIIVELTIMPDDVVYDLGFATPQINWTMPDEELIVNLIGIPEISDGDTVTFCLTQACDLTRYCDAPNCIDEEYCWEYYVDGLGPDVTLVSPPDSAHISCCGDIPIVIEFSDRSGIDVSSINIEIDGTLYTGVYAEIDSVTGRYSLNIPGVMLPDCEEHTIEIVSASDELGNTISDINWTFTTDCTPPFMVDHVPSDGEVVPNDFIDIFFTDECSDYAQDSTILTFRVIRDGGIVIDTIILGTNPSIRWSGDSIDTMSFAFGDLGYTLENEDTIRICVNTMSDILDYFAPGCGYNVFHATEADTTEEYCFTYSVSFNGPATSLMCPPAGSYIPCRDFPLMISVFDEDGIDETTFDINVDGVTYDYSSFDDYLTDPADSRMDTIIIDPPGEYPICDTVRIVVNSCTDVWGSTVSIPVNTFFIVDEEPPTHTYVYPGAGVELAGDLALRVHFEDPDCGSLPGSGVSHSSAQVWFPAYPPDTLTSPHAALSWALDTLVIDIRETGLPIVSGSYIDYCIRVTDNTVDLACAPGCPGPNTYEVCDSFIISASGPIISAEFPSANTISACASIDSIVIELDDTDDIDWSSFDLVVNSVAYSDEDVTIRGADGSYSVLLPVSILSDTLITVAITVSDGVGNESIYSYSFVLDHTPPEFMGIYPVCGDTIESNSPIVRISLHDDGSTVNQDDVCIAFCEPTWADCDTYCVDSAPAGLFTWTSMSELEINTEIISYFVAGGDSGRYFIANACDIVDTCEPNCISGADSCGWVVSAIGPEVRLLAPHFNRMSIGCAIPGYAFQFSITDENGVDTGSLELTCTSTTGGPATYTLGTDFYLVSDDTLFEFVPPADFADGDSIIISITGHDLIGNPIRGNRFAFARDISAPEFEILTPLPPEAYTLSPIVRLFFDDFVGTDPSMTTLYLTTSTGVIDSFRTPDTEVTWIGDSMIVDYTYTFETNDTLTFCVDQAYDLVDTCVNSVALDTCWSVVIMQGGPFVEPYYPSPMTYICPEDSFVWFYYDVDGVDTSTIEIVTPDGTYGYGDPEVSYLNDTLYFVPSTPLSVETVDITIQNGQDLLGYVMEPYTMTYYMDLTPPDADLISPIGTTPEYSTPIVIEITDLVNAIDSTSIILEINETRRPLTTTYSLPADDAVLSWDKTTGLLTFNGDSTYTFRAGDSIVICLTVSDSTGCAGSNTLTECWTFNLELGDGPAITLIDPASSGTCISCTDSFVISMNVESTHPADDTTLSLRFTSTGITGCDYVYSLDSSQVRFDDTASILYFAPPLACLEDGESFTMNFIDFYDIFGNPVNPAVFTFNYDISGPIVVNHSPSAPVSVPRPEIRFVVTDAGCGVDTLSPVVHFGMDRYEYGDAGVRWSGDTLIVLPDGRLSGGDSVRVCLDTLYDIVSYSECPANILSEPYCFNVYVAGGGPICELLTPRDSSYTSCACQEVVISFSDPEGIVEDALMIHVNGMPLDVTSPGVTYVDDVLTYTPTGADCFEDGDEITVAIAECTDTLDNHSELYFWTFNVDVSAPNVVSQYPLPGEVVYELSPVIELTVDDMYNSVAGYSEVTIYDNGAIVGELTTDSPSVSVISEGNFEVNTELAGLSFCEFHEICVEFLVSDVMDTAYCPFNDTTINWCFTIGDDDSTGPVFAFDSCAWPAYSESLYISVHINDTSGIYDDDTDTLGQGIYVVVDTTGSSFSDPEALTILQMSHVMGDVYQTAPGSFPAALLRENIPFCYRVYAYDNDFDCDTTYDRMLAVSDSMSCFIYNIEPPVLTVVMPQDTSYYSCVCGEQSIEFTLVDPDQVRLDDLVIDINGTRYEYPHSQITTSGSPDAMSVVWTPTTEECFEDGDEINVSVFGYADRFFNYPDYTPTWSFTADQTPPVITYADTDSVMIYAEDVIGIPVHVYDENGEIDPSSIQIEVNVNGESSYMLYDGDAGIIYNPDIDTLYIDIREIGGITPTARDSIFFTIVQICDNTTGCDPNCADPYEFYKFIKYETICQAHPKPFSPNNDDINDMVKIEYPKRFDNEATITIFDTNSNEIKSINGNRSHQYLWDGTDSSGNECRQGVYIFVVEVDGEVVCTGSIVLAR